jgi:subfamily B ATP-binding cassette protein MsbA
MLCIVVVSSLLNLTPPVCLQIWSTSGDSLDAMRILWIIFILLVTNIVNAILVLYRESYANKFNKENARSYLRNFMNMKYDRIIQEGPSNLLERIVTAVTGIYAYMTGGHIQIWSSIFIAIAAIVMLSQISLIISVAMLLFIPFIYCGFKLINKELTNRSIELQTQTGLGFQEIMSYIQEPDYFKQLPSIEPIIQKMNPALDKIYDAMASINKFAQTSSIALSSLGTILQNVIMLLVVYSFLESKTSPYLLMIATIIVPLYFEAVQSITRANVDKKDYVAALDLEKLLKDSGEKSGGSAITAVVSLSIDVNKIELADEMLDFEAHADLKKGDIGRIYGKSGCGKSTFAKALLKFRRVDGVKINGVSLSDIDNRELRKSVEYVSQNIPIIKGTVRDNLMFGKEYLDVEDSELQKNPLLYSILSNKTLEDEILEGGANLSGGEKQKIAIVRALLSEPEILILDEVCSNIDNQTSKEIYEMLKFEREKRITIIISHDELPEGFVNVDITNSVKI